MNRILLFCGVILVFSLLPGCKDEPQVATINRPQTIFEGTWTWLKTEGEGIAGHYISDSVSVGYSLHYSFGFNDLQTFRNGQPYEQFSYTFTFNEGNPLGSMLTLTRPGMVINYFYEIEFRSDSTFLNLRNTEPCCDNTFVQQFRLIGRPTIESR